MHVQHRSLDARLLHALRAAGAGGISNADLCAKLDAPASTINERLAELRELGYDIETGPHFGLRLVKGPSALHADDLYGRLHNANIIGRDIRVFSETTSTNDIVEKLARDGVEEGVVVFAESQTKGRGRMGRRWASPPGAGLWFSVLLRPKLPPQSVTRLTIGAATAVSRAIQAETNIVPDIKWPNDLLFEGKKLVGILTEMNAELDAVRHVIPGIGINVNQTREDFPPDLQETATSLRMITGREVDRSSLAARALMELDHDYSRILRGEFTAIAEEWEERCGTVGQVVRIRVGDRVIAGRCEALDPDGALVVRTEHGRLERVTGGDVTVEKN